MGILKKIEDEQQRRAISFRSGDSVKVHVRIKEGDKERIQVYEGVVIRLCRGGNRASFTVRKISYGVGVERVFPLHSPSVEKIELVTAGKVRRSRLFYLRGRRGKAARLKERDMRGSVTFDPATGAPETGATATTTEAEAAPAEA